MAEIRIIDWPAVRDKFLGRTIEQLDRLEPVSVALKEPPHLAIGNAAVSFGASGRLEVTAFHDPHDTDRRRVVGVAAGAGTGNGSEAKLTYSGDRAWLCYSITGELSSEARATLQRVGANVAASAEIVFADYRIHDRLDPAEPKVLDDLSAPRSALSIDAILSMRRGEALYYEGRGDLGFSVAVRWPDIWSKALTDVVPLLPGRLFTVDVEAAGNATFRITLTDDFVLLFWRDDEGLLHTAVRKAAARSTAAGVTLGVTAAFSDPEAIENAVESILHAAFGEPLAVVTELLSTATGTTLTPAERQVFDAVATALGLDCAVAAAREVQEALARLRTAVQTKVKESVETHIAASWKYEYARLETTECVMEASLSEKELRAIHPSLIVLDASPMLEEARRGALRLTKYLDETTVLRSSAHGFTLGAGKWFRIGDRDEKKLTMRTRRSLDGTRSMISCIGARSFSGSRQWSIGSFDFDLRAEMSSYAEAPQASDFEFAMMMSMTTASQRLDSDSIPMIADTATLWSIVPQEQTMELAAKIARIEGATATARYQLTFDETALRQIAPRAASAPVRQIAAALAAAMPWGRFAGRRDWPMRQKLYAEAWTAILEGSDPGDACAIGRASMLSVNRLLAQLDGTPAHMWTLRSVIDGHPHVASHYANWISGAQTLASALTDGTLPAAELPAMFAKLYDFFSQIVYVRALGRHLLDVAATGEAASVRRVLSIAYDRFGQRRTLTFGA